MWSLVYADLTGGEGYTLRLVVADDARAAARYAARIERTEGLHTLVVRQHSGILTGVRQVLSAAEAATLAHA